MTLNRGGRMHGSCARSSSLGPGQGHGADAVLSVDGVHNQDRIPTQIAFSNSLCFPCFFPCATANFPCANLRDLCLLHMQNRLGRLIQLQTKFGN